MIAMSGDTLRFARLMRHEPTRAEEILWSKLRNRTLGGLIFSRQVPIGNYIVDFVCRQQRLIIEVDSATHGTVHEIEHDLLRTAWLSAQGYRVHHVWNQDVYENLDGVLETVLLLLSDPPHPPLRHLLP